jgi:DNA mismatch repair protein MutL
VIVEAGQVKAITETGCPVGTSVLVSHIFDPVPVRKKFLKTEMTEQGYCVDVITRMALSCPEVRIKVSAHKKELLNIPATGDISERISLVLGTDYGGHMIPVKGTRESVMLAGFASKPEYSRSNAKQMYFYVNRRFVRDYLLNHAVMTAYRRLIEAKRYPAAVMFIDLPPEDVDVNVHPAKMEVRFRNPREIYDIVVEALAAALANIAPLLSSEGARTMPEGYSERVREALKRYTISSGSGKLFFDKGIGDSRITGKAINKVQEKDAVRLERLPEERGDELGPAGRALNFTDLEYIGQIAGTYLVFSSSAGLTLVDQHAAHERVLFEKLKKGSLVPGEKIISQQLLMPEIVSLSHGEFAVLTEYIKILEDSGIEVEHFGEKTVIVKSLPALLSHIEPKKLFFEIIEEFSKTEKPLGLEARREKVFALLACKGAVKANQILTESEVAMLCKDLDNTSFSSTCPHGRPVFISFGLWDLESMFKRK